jgi:hypothetical protein
MPREGREDWTEAKKGQLQIGNKQRRNHRNENRPLLNEFQAYTLKTRHQLSLLGFAAEVLLKMTSTDLTSTQI